MNRLTTRQRRILVLLGAFNLVVVLGVAIALLRAPGDRETTSFASPLTAQRIEACRKATSDALVHSGHSGMVQAQENGTILVQIQRPHVPGDVRLDMDASTWAAFEAVTSGGDCLRFVQVQVTLDYPDATDCVSTHDGGAACQATSARAQVGMADLVLWSLGEIDDEQLSLRLDYQLPETLAPEADRDSAPP